MYAIVRTGGKQHKVAVGDVITVEKIAGSDGAVTLPALLVVDGAEVTSDATALAGIAVTAEVVAHTKGPKINILKYKNKTGYRRRKGHRQQLTQLRVTGIDAAAKTSGSGR
ncbi:MAG: 50S ribosomal protein L21 [Actinomycetota bacterium]|nr:50S ribosomal protein L21 [Actinomycetota bacterium]